MPNITDHFDGHGLTESIVLTCDERSEQHGGASHRYEARMASIGPANEPVLSVQFQKGPRNDPDATSGVVEAVLLAIVADRMKAFQKGPYGCRENALVLTKVEEALHWLRHRADDRARRGVLGTSQK